MSDELGIPVEAAVCAEAALKDADVICTVTTSPTPVFEDRWLKPGAHINALRRGRWLMQRRWEWVAGEKHGFSAILPLESGGVLV